MNGLEQVERLSVLARRAPLARSDVAESVWRAIRARQEAERSVLPLFAAAAALAACVAMVVAAHWVANPESWFYSLQPLTPVL